MFQKKTAIEKIVEKQTAKPKDYKKTFGTESGKRVLYDLIDSHFVMRPTFVPNDPYATARNEGERNVVLRIITMLNTDPEKIKQLIEESNNYVQTMVE